MHWYRANKYILSKRLKHSALMAKIVGLGGKVQTCIFFSLPAAWAKTHFCSKFKKSYGRSLLQKIYPPNLKCSLRIWSPSKCFLFFKQLFPIACQKYSVRCRLQQL